MRRLQQAAIALVLCLTVVPACFGWGADAHKIIAAIAWHDMTPEARAAVEFDTPLRSMPDKALGREC